MEAKWERLLPVTGWVIIVEDDPTLRMSMVEILAEIGLRSLEFATADAALTYLLETHGCFSLVIADLGLPGQIQGAQFVEIVQSKWPLTSAILTSGHELDFSIVPSSTTYLHKPWSMDDLVIAVATRLQPCNPIHKR